MSMSADGRTVYVSGDASYGVSVIVCAVHPYMQGKVVVRAP
jgi:hypothetical protein